MEPKFHFLLLLRYLKKKKTTTKTANTQTGSDLNNYSSTNEREDDEKGIKGPKLFLKPQRITGTFQMEPDFRNDE